MRKVAISGSRWKGLGVCAWGLHEQHVSLRRFFPPEEKVAAGGGECMWGGGGWGRRYQAAH